MGLNDLNSFLDDVEKGDKISSVGLSMMKAHGTNPDKYSQLKKLEQQTGRPAQWMADDPTIEQDAQRSIDLDGKKWEMLASHSPKVADYYTDPEKAKVSIDDHENLSAIEKTFDVIKRSGGSLAASLWSTSEGLWGVPRAAGDLLQGVTKPLADVTGLPLDIGGALSEYAKKEQHYAGQWAAWARGDNSKLGGFENSVYQGFESLGGNLLLAPITIASGTPTPMLAGMSGSAGGKAYGEARDKNLSPVTSLIHGTSQGAIEYATEMIPAMRFVEAMNGKTLFSKAIKGVLGADIVGEQYATVLQDLNDWATINPEKPFKAYLEERPSAAAQTLVATIVGTGGMVATAKGIQAAGQSFEKHLEAKKQSDFLLSLGDSVKASKTFARLPENIKELVRNIKQDGDIQDVYIPVEKLNQLFQSKGLDAGQQMDQILTDPKRYYEALATGGDVAIPLEDFAALAGDEIYSELVGDARLKLDGISSNEAATLNDPATKERLLNDLLAQAEESDTAPIEGVQKEAYQRFYDDTYGQLIGIGRNPEQSDKESILRAKLLSTLMQRGGYTEDYLNQMFPVSITRGALPDALSKQKSADTVGFESRIGEMLDQLRNGKAPKESEIFGKSLLEFLRDKGLQDQGGELKGFELDRGKKFKKKIVRADGLTLDMAREAAAEAGYLPMNSSVSDFLDLIGSESRGNAVYSQQSGNQALLDKKLELDQLQEWLDAMDVDLSQADNSSLLQLMQKSVEGERLNQTLPEKMTIDGVERWTVNSKGQSLAQTEAGIKKFWAWFGNSKVVDTDGRPMVVYHGGNGGVTEFDPKRAGEVNKSDWGQGVYFTPLKSQADGYKEDANKAIDNASNELWDRMEALAKSYGTDVMSVSMDLRSGKINQQQYDEINDLDKQWRQARKDAAANGEGEVYATYLRILNPEFDKFVGITDPYMSSRAESNGKDGIIITFEDGSFDELVAFSPTQIKSVFNSGEFDPKNPNILFQTDKGSAEGEEAYSVTKTLKLGMLAPAVLKDGIVTAAGIGATHYDVHKVVKADFGDKVDVTGFITPDGKFLDRKESNEWLKENRKDIYRRLDRVTKENGLESQAYANAEGVTSESSNAAADFLKRHFGTATTFFQSVGNALNGIQLATSGNFETGVPVTFNFVHNTESATKLFGKPKKDSPYDRGLEPSGRYVTEVGDLSKLQLADNMISGKLTFASPLVVEGKEWKKSLSAQFGNKRGKHLSKAIIAAGYDGIVTIQDGKSGRYVSEILDLTTFDEAKALYQRQQDTKRGYIQFTRGVPGFEIALLKDANASTFIHETGHYYFEIMRHLASQENVPQQIADDFNSLLKWLGAENSEALTVKQLEQLADGFTEYLSEGKAPSVELQGVFSRFKVWLKAIYMTFKNADVEMSDEVRGIFDRWLATDEEIAAAQDRVQAKPMFSTAQDAGMSERVFTAYKKLAEEAHEAARTRLDTQKYKEANRIHQQWWKEAYAAMSAEVEAEAKENPVYEVLNFIRTGKLFDGSVYEGDASRLDGVALKRMYDSATLKGFSKKLGIFYQNEGGVNPEDAAQMFGFGSADEMIKKMVEAPKMREWVKAETDRRMLETYPEKNSTEIADDALAAVNNDDLAKVFREELRAIKRKVKEVKPFVDAEKSAKREERQAAFGSIPPLDYFRDAAKQHIAGLKIAELQPYRFALAEAKAGKEALTENGKGSYAKAAEAKQRQILNHYLYREALNAQEMADKAVTYMRKLDSKKKQQALGKAGQEYLDQINNLLEQYEFKQVPLYYLAERERLLDWIHRKEQETGQTFPIDTVILADAKQVNYKTLTVDVLSEVYRTAKVIDFLAMNHNKLVKDQQKRDLMDVADEVAASIELHGGKKKKRAIEKGLPQDAPFRQLKNYFSGMRAMSSIARQMDGGADGGLVWNTLVRPLNEAADKEAAMSSKATEEADRIFSVYSAVERSTMTIRRLVPGTDINLSHWGRLMVALNMGNEGNRDRLLATFNTQEVAAILDTLDERDFQVVQNTWDWISSFKPEIAAKEKRVNGIEPEWVDATPLETKFGILAGGYFPIFYDLDESERADAQNETTIAAQMKGGMFAHASTRRGHLEARLNHLNRKLDFGIENVFRHVNQVIHDISHHEALIDINKVLGMDSIQDAMRDYHGTEAYKIFRDGVTDVAVGSAPARNAFEKFMQYTRIGSTTAALGWNISTSLLQPLGLSQSIVRIGAEWTAKGVAKWLGSPQHMIGITNQIYEKSVFMRERSKTMNRELAEVSQKLQPGIVPGVVKDSFFYLIQATQKMVDIPTWLGQYEKSMAAHGNESDAIAESNQAVIDAQAHGQVKDLARFQRGAPLMKMFTMFSSYFFRTWNLTAESAGKTNFKSPAEMGKFIVDLTMLYVVPAAISAAVFDVAIQSAIGGDPDEDKFWKGFYSKIIGGVINPFPGLNQMNSLISGFNGYEGPAGARVFAEVGKFAKQAGQGEADVAFWKSANNIGGIIGQYPSGQINKTVQGMIELSEGRGNALSLMFGKPKK